jgi:hypothetical protein
MGFGPPIGAWSRRSAAIPYSIRDETPSPAQAEASARLIQIACQFSGRANQDFETTKSLLNKYGKSSNEIEFFCFLL